MPILPTSTLISLVVGLAVGVVALRMILVARRNRRQLEALMVRVEQLEQGLLRAAPVALTLVEDPGDAAESEDYSGDVLAGWTSRVNQVITKAAIPRDLCPTRS